MRTVRSLNQTACAVDVNGPRDLPLHCLMRPGTHRSGPASPRVSSTYEDAAAGQPARTAAPVPHLHRRTADGTSLRCGEESGVRGGAKPSRLASHGPLLKARPPSHATMHHSGPHASPLTGSDVAPSRGSATRCSSPNR